MIAELRDARIWSAKSINTGIKIMLYCEPRRSSVLKIIFIGIEGSGYARVFRSF
jgi:hypothetical protein